MPGLAELTEKRELEELGTSMARLPSRAGPGLVCYAARVQRLGAVLSNGAAPICPGRWHSVRPPHGTPGAAILTRTEAAQGPVEHAQERRKRKWWVVGWIWRSVQSPMAAERESDSTEPPGSETLLDAVLRNLYDLGERGSREEAAEDGGTPGHLGPARVTRSPGAMPAGWTYPCGASLSETFSATSWPTFRSLSHCAEKKNQSVLLKTGNCLAHRQKDSYSQAEELTCGLPEF